MNTGYFVMFSLHAVNLQQFTGELENSFGDDYCIQNRVVGGR